jgi:hypothetical protein
MKGELYINNVRVDLEEGVPFPLSFAITDISDLSKRRGNKSKTVVLPGTSTNQNFFFNLFSVTLSDSPIIDFDPTVKAVARYYLGSLLQFNGICQLQKCIRENQSYKFEINLFGEVIDFNARMSSVKLNELDWSDTSHVLNQTNIEDSWVSNVPYYYGLVHYGFNPTTPDTFDVDEIPPQAYLKDVLDRLASNAGFNYQSQFLSSPFFESLLLCYGGGAYPSLSPAQADDESVKGTDLLNVVRNLASTGFTATQRRLSDSTLINTGVTITQDVLSQTTSANPLIILTETSGLFQVQYVGSHDLTMTFDPQGKTIGGYTITLNLILEIRINNSLISNDIIWSDSTTNFSYSNTIAVNYIKGLTLNVGDVVSFNTRLDIPTTTFTVSLLPSTVPFLNYTIQANTATFDLIKLPQEITEGSTINLSSFMPEMSGADFFKGLVTMFNLIVVPVEDSPNEFFIEPFEDFYQDANIDWSAKLDTEKPIEIIPTINFAPKEFQLLFKDDQSEFRKRYFNQTGKRYGDRTVQSNTQYAKDVTVMQLPFTAVPMVQLTSPSSNLILPNVTDVNPETNDIKPFRGTAFVMQKIGLVTANWTLKATAKTSYPQISHVSSTSDLLFLKPDILFYTATSYPNSNLFDFHKQRISELISRFGKMLRAKFRLNADDINRLDLRNIVRVDKVKYKVNSIENYDALTYDSCDVELIKIQTDGNN